MEGEGSRVAMKAKAVAEAEPISVQTCCSFAPVENRYKECRRNHAASFGRYAFDGCGEFMSCNDDVFTCAACGCHRSFHRNDQLNRNPTPPQPQPQPQPPPPPPPHPHPIPPKRPFLSPLPLSSHNGLTGETSVFPKFEPNTDAGSQTLSGAEVEVDKDTKKIRAKRTKLTMEQKSKMMRFADKLGWRLQRHDDEEILQFCAEVGVTKRVFLVWVNNNRRRKGSV